MPTSRSAPLFVGLVLAAAVAGCGSSSKTAAPASTTSSTAAGGAAGIPCTPDLAATATTAPPSDVPFVPGGTTYLSKGPFGTTSLFFESVAADPANLDATRDAAVAALTAKGYTVGRKDQEEGSEAEATLTGPHSIAIQVIQLCVGHVRVKYTITPPDGATPAATAAASASPTG